MALIDLHCHTSASFDGVGEPTAMAARAVERGLTHLVITDHDTIDGALRARDGAPDGLVVIVGSETLTRQGDLIFVYLREAIPTDLDARDAIAAAREQGALVGIPHPFDRRRRSLLRNPDHLDLVALVDWIETRNGRVTSPSVDEEAAALARRVGIPGVGASDAHTLLEVGATYTGLEGDIASPERLLAALRGPITIHTSIGGPSADPQRRGRRLPWQRGRPA